MKNKIESSKQRKPKLTADDLLKTNDTTRRLRKKNYKIVYEKCIFAIESVHEYCKYDFTTFIIPDKLVGEPFYDLDECIIYLKEELRKANFYVRVAKPGNVLYISWRQQDVEKVKKYNEKMKEKEDARAAQIAAQNAEQYGNQNVQNAILHYDPNDPLSNMHLTAALMMENSKYDHLPSVKRTKNGN
jgi:hypothetical protein